MSSYLQLIEDAKIANFYGDRLQKKGSPVTLLLISVRFTNLGFVFSVYNFSL